MEKFGVLCGEASPGEVFEYLNKCMSKQVSAGIMKNGLCINAACFYDLETAERFLEKGVWPGADSVAVLPEGYGIGDYCDGTTGTWTKREAEVSEEASQTLASTIMAAVSRVMGYPSKSKYH